MLIRSDARHIPLKDKSMQCCVTSPPYWGLRDYGTPGQLGLERTPEEYVANMVQVFREVWRVLRDDGTLWLNLGDSYAAGRCGRDDDDEENLRRRFEAFGTGRPKAGRKGASGHARSAPPGLKPKDLVGIPWRVAFALQSDGWYLRSEIIWDKPNCMPESVKDRPTKSHEQIFLLSKSERYYYDADAIAEAQEESERRRRLREQSAGLDTKYSLARDLPHGQPRPGENGVARSCAARQKIAQKDTKNARSVWRIPTTPNRAAAGIHFATWPRWIPERCILAGSAKGDVVFDPFCGTGVTQMVARDLGRIGIGSDLTYQSLAADRIQGPLFAKIVNSDRLGADRESERVQGDLLWEDAYVQKHPSRPGRT